MERVVVTIGRRAKGWLGVAAWVALALVIYGFIAPAPALAGSGAICQSACTSCCNAGPPTCAEGYSLYQDQCLPSCPPGFRRYPGYPGLCLPPSIHGCPDGYEPVPFPNCPVGYHRDIDRPGACAPDAEVPQQCPRGFTYDAQDGRCGSICPAGTYRDETGLCRSVYEKECPQGWTRDQRTDQCVPPGTWPEGYGFFCLPVCPQGFIRDFNEPLRCRPPVETCLEGSEMVDGRCLPECADGLIRDNTGWCKPARACPDGTYPDQAGNCTELTCPEGYERLGATCLQPCPQGQRRDPENFLRCLPPPTTSCPDGQRLNAKTNKCEQIPVTPRCKQGETLNTRTNKCERKGTTAKPGCAEGFVKDENGRCVPLVDEQPDCGRGFIMDENGRCVPIRLNRPTPTDCPDGMIFSTRRGACVPFDNGGPTIAPNDFVPIEPGRPRLTPNFNDLQIEVPERAGRDCPEGLTFNPKRGTCVQG